jgi:hypothetical protein
MKSAHCNKIDVDTDANASLMGRTKTAVVGVIQELFCLPDLMQCACFVKSVLCRSPHRYSTSTLLKDRRAQSCLNIGTSPKMLTDVAGGQQLQ